MLDYDLNTKIYLLKTLFNLKLKVKTLKEGKYEKYMKYFRYARQALEPP